MCWRPRQHTPQWWHKQLGPIMTMMNEEVIDCTKMMRMSTISGGEDNNMGSLCQCIDDNIKSYYAAVGVVEGIGCCNSLVVIIRQSPNVQSSAWGAGMP